MAEREGLQSLLEQGIIDAVLRPLMSGKEAQVFLVEVGGELRVAKIYKEAAHRSFKHRAIYTEGRQARRSRDQRAMKKGRTTVCGPHRHTPCPPWRRPSERRP